MKLHNAFLSQLVRLRHSPLLWLHIVGSITPPLLIGTYFAVTPWDSFLATDVYMQILGALMPLASALVMAFDIDTERQAGELSTLLAVPSRATGLLGKMLAYFLAAVLTLLSCVVLFAVILTLHGRQIPSLHSLSLALCALILGSAVLYPFSTWCALRFSRNATIAWGTVFSVIAVSSLGGLAHTLVSGQLSSMHTVPALYAMPMAWATKMASIAIEHDINPAVSLVPLGIHSIIALAATSIVMLVLCLWFTHFEDRKRA